MRMLRRDGEYPLYQIDVCPCPAPRQTRSDQYRVRPAVARYRLFRDLVRAEWRECKWIGPADYMEVTFWIPMPKTWSQKKKDQMVFRPHQGKPDLDNLAKGFWDAIYRDEDDSHIYHAVLSKYWAPGPGCIHVRSIDPPWSIPVPC